MQENEDESLQQALGEAGASAVDMVQALEQHLAKFPKTDKRPEIERVLLKASIGAGDQKRIDRDTASGCWPASPWI